MNREDIDRLIDDVLGRPKKCPHPWRHTVYGASDPKRNGNGTSCVICGAKL